MTTERSRNRETGPWTGTTSVYHNGSLTGTPTYPIYESSEAMVDYVTPNFRKAIASGAIINNPVSYEKSSLQAEGGGFIRAVHPDDPENVYEYIGGSITQTGVTYCWNFSEVGHLNVDSTASVDAAKFYAVANIDSTPYAFLEDTFEIRETLRFLRNPIGSLVKLSKEFKKVVKTKRKSKSVPHVAKAISDVWLEYRFAFSPLLRSVDDAIDYLHKDLAKTPERRTARGFSKSELRKSGTFFGRTYNHVASPTWHFDRSTQRRVEVRAGILYAVSNPVDGVRFDLGIRNKDIPETIWAIMPYSFMVDRVANISKSIRGLTNLLDPNVEVLAGWVVTKDDKQTVYRLTDHVSGGWIIQTLGDNVRRKDFTYNRVKWSPTASDTVPPVDIGGLVKDATSIADLLALVYSNITR
jgi:hypothetical protein